MTKKSMGAQSIQCMTPNETEWPMRTCARVRPATTSKHDCLRVVAIQSLTAEAGSDTTPKPEGPPEYSTKACQTNMRRATMSREASQTWLLSAGERVLKLGRPNSDCQSGSCQYVILQISWARRTGGTRRLSGLGGKIGITMRSITNAEEKKETSASARVGMSGNILVTVLIVFERFQWVVGSMDLMRSLVQGGMCASAVKA